MSKFGLSERQLSVLEGVLEKSNIRGRARIFGSRAKGKHRPNSDIDIAVLNAKPNELSRLRGDFYDSSLPFRVDVVDFDRLTKQSLKESIAREGVIV